MTIEISPSRALIQAGWKDVPHLDEKTQQELLRSTPRYQRTARTKGIPSLGAGAIYPYEESEITEAPLRPPPFWPRAYAMDVGWDRTAVLWGAHDRESDVIHVYTEHYQGRAEPSIHATAIQARGDWIPGIIDPAARGRSQESGKRLWEMYLDLGLRLRTAKNAVEAGLFEVQERFASGRLKIVSTCQNTLREYRLYRRNDKGHIVKEHDHAMDALRYLVMGLEHFKTQPVAQRPRGGGGDRKAGY